MPVAAGAGARGTKADVKLQWSRMAKNMSMRDIVEGMMRHCCELKTLAEKIQKLESILPGTWITYGC